MTTDGLATPPGVQPVERPPVASPESLGAADAILLAIAKVSAEVHALGGQFEAHKLQTTEQIAALKARVDGSLPPAPLAPGEVPEPSLSSQVRAIRTELADQSRVMGIGMRGIDWLFSKDGRTAFVRLATACSAAYAALHAAGVVK